MSDKGSMPAEFISHPCSVALGKRDQLTLAGGRVTSNTDAPPSAIPPRMELFRRF